MDHPPKKSAQWCPTMSNKGNLNGRLISNHCFVFYKRHDYNSSLKQQTDELLWASKQKKHSQV